MLTNRIRIADYPFFNIVGDGGMSMPEIGDGRFIPAIIIDIEDRSDVAELLKVHQGSEPGDTKLTWSIPATIFKPKIIYLNLEFTKPMEIQFGIQFSVQNHFALIDGVIQSRCFLLEAGQVGDKVSEFKNDRIMIEVPKLGFDSGWNRILLDCLKKKYKMGGNSGKQSSKMAREHMKSMREVWNIRRPLQ